LLLGACVANIRHKRRINAAKKEVICRKGAVRWDFPENYRAAFMPFSSHKLFNGCRQDSDIGLGSGHLQVANAETKLNISLVAVS
jgi:hypothetical protein